MAVLMAICLRDWRRSVRLVSVRAGQPIATGSTAASPGCANAARVAAHEE